MPEDPTVTQPGTAEVASPQARTFTQDELNAFLAEERRKLQQQQRDTDAKTKADAEAKAAEANGEFQKLANQRQADLDRLTAERTTEQEQLTAYRDEMERQVVERIRALPEELRTLDPGGDALARFTWLGKAEAAAAKLTQAQQVRSPGTPPGPRGGMIASAGTTSEEILARKRASGIY